MAPKWLFFIISIVYSQLEQFTVDVAILGYGWDENNLLQRNK